MGPKEFEITGRIEILQTAELLRSARISRKPYKTCIYSDTSENLPDKAG